AGFAGALLGMIYTFSPDFGRPFLLRSFVIIVLGGLESVSGVALGALVLAFVETFGPYVPIPWYWHGWFFYHFSDSLQPAISFGLLVVVLLIMPKGLASLFARKRRLPGNLFYLSPPESRSSFPRCCWRRCCCCRKLLPAPTS